METKPMRTQLHKWLLFVGLIIFMGIILFMHINTQNEIDKIAKAIGARHLRGESDWLKFYLSVIGFVIFMWFIFIFKVDDRRQKLTAPFMIIIGMSSLYLPYFQYRTTIAGAALTLIILTAWLYPSRNKEHQDQTSKNIK